MMAFPDFPLMFRETEKTYLKTRDDEGKTVPNVWERVVNQVDLNAAPSKATKVAAAGAKNAPASAAATDAAPKKDTSRMKSLLLQLKNDGKAPGNAVLAA
jgi:hypothetical protein